MNNLMQAYENPQAAAPQAQNNSPLAAGVMSREASEVMGQVMMAKQFPRNIFQAEQRILDTCQRPALAQVAMYRYPKGGTNVTGPSIRLAEAIAQNWGNLSYGIQEIEQKDGESVAKAYCWDLETNVRQEKTFHVKHAISTKKGLKLLTDPRDIYEKVANDGARRLRACILGVIPGDIVDKALQQCTNTLAGNSKGPLKDRIANALKAFKENYKVTQAMIETRFGYNADSFGEIDYVDLINIFNSLRDGMSKVEDWFDKSAGKTSEDNALNKALKDEKQAPKEEVTPDAAGNGVPVDQGELPL